MTPLFINDLFGRVLFRRPSSYYKNPFLGVRSASLYALKRRNEYVQSRREAIAFANKTLLPLLGLPQGKPYFKSGRLFGLSDIEDKRTWHPEGIWRSPRTVTGQASRIIRRVVPVEKPVGVFRRGPFEMYFHRDFDRVVTCIRRKARREIMHALGHSGKKGQRSPRFNPDSMVKCSDIYAREEYLGHPR